jgi:hypothetical protein
MYEQRPDLFSDDDVYKLEEAAMRFGRRFVRAEHAAPFNLYRTISQLVTGFASGFTTLKIGDEPRNAAEAVAGSLGHLLGFIGFVPNPMSIAAKFGLRTFAKTAIRESLSLGWRFKSAPMYVADKAMDAIKYSTRGGAGNMAQKFFTQNPVVADVLQAGTHLGIASAVASAQPWELEIEDRMRGFVHGGLFGAGSRLLGNLMSTGGKLDVAKAIKQGDMHPVDFHMKQDEANMFARMLTSSLLVGGMSTLRGDPIELQVYEYLTGAYFGKVEMGIHKRRALEFAQPYLQSETGRLRLVSPEKLPGWEGLSKQSQTEVKMITETQLAVEATQFAMFESIRQGQEYYRNLYRNGQLSAEELARKEKVAEQFRFVEDLVDTGMPMDKAMEVGRREIIKARKQEVDLMDFLFKGRRCFNGS